MAQIEKKLKELGIEIPDAVAPVANYVGFNISGNQIFVSGQLPIENGALAEKYVGKVGDKISIETASEAARICGINIVSQLKLATNGDLDKIKKCVRLGIFVNATPNFEQQPVVANGCSDLIVEIFGDKGKHARAAVGAGSLPRGVCVEIDAIFEI